MIQTKVQAAAGVSEGQVWVVVVSKPGQEIIAKDHLKQQEFDTYLPMRLYENKQGETRASPFLPNYLFARVPLLVTEWRSIFSTQGVKSVLGYCGGRAFGVKDTVVDRIRAREEAGYIKLGLKEDDAPRRFGHGERVRCDDLVDAMFLEMVDARRGLILVSFFGGRDSRQIVDIKRLAAMGHA